ncbi:hypothetical protein [Acidianus sp. HS-5]|uniref:hypothetical protein n=1 Tax=Acidianus sp. HS-5 TaxID=2886040 RepID=UPI001F377519|nr:hypothetical protein [Acidianus sp. HS-5]BDC18515.1 hypothetical protein HS5_14050 [Acidianus sp. HS-5]
MDKDKALAVNFSQIIFAITMLLFSNPNYDNLLFISGDVTLVFLSGILLFTKIKVEDELFNTIIYAEAFAVGLLYYFAGTPIYVLVVYLAIVLLGIRFNFLTEALLVNFLILTVFTVRVAKFGTDEMMLSYYAASLFLHGENPYNPALMQNVYSVLHLNMFIFGTPLSTGGVVTSYDYPALQMLLLVPSVLLHFNPNYITVAFYVIIPFILYFKREDKLTFITFLLFYLIDINYRNYSAGGVTTMDWLIFALLSLLFKDVRKKGIFYGLALSVKQTPFALFPFYLVYLYKEGYSMIKFLAYSALTFLIVNGYFILLSPTYYIQGVLYPVTAPLVGISMSVSMYSIAGFFYIYPKFFTLALAVVMVAEVYLFWKHYDNFKDSWTFFPYFIFFVNYRALWNYFFSWPILGYSLPSSSRGIKVSKSALKVLAVPLLLLVGLATFFHFAYTPYCSSIGVEVLHIYEENGRVYCLLLNVTYCPKSPSLPSCIRPLVRIFPDANAISAYGYIFYSNSTFLKAYHWEVIRLWSPHKDYYVPDSPFRIEVYYGNLVGIACGN